MIFEVQARFQNLPLGVCSHNLQTTSLTSVRSVMASFSENSNAISEYYKIVFLKWERFVLIMLYVFQALNIIFIIKYKYCAPQNKKNGNVIGFIFIVRTLLAIFMVFFLMYQLLHINFAKRHSCKYEIFIIPQQWQQYKIWNYSKRYFLTVRRRFSARFTKANSELMTIVADGVYTCEKCAITRETR